MSQPHSSNTQGNDEAEVRENEDFYFEGKAMVFTARFHLKRGYCCQSGCRHCPYKEQPKQSS